MNERAAHRSPNVPPDKGGSRGVGTHELAKSADTCAANPSCPPLVRGGTQRQTFVRVLILLLLLMPFSVFARATSPQGVWSGTIGTKAIVACFNRNHDGSYYYIDYLKPIALRARYKNSPWREYTVADNGSFIKETGLWELAAPVDGIIAGTWRNEKTGKFLPIHLALVDGNNDGSACTRDSYNLRLESAPKVKRGKTIRFSHGRSYRKLWFAGQETIELFGPDPALDRINLLLKPDRSKGAVDAYFQQKRESLGRLGYPAVDEQYTKPVYWDSNFITISFYLWATGSESHETPVDHRTWNIKTGEEVDLWQWIGSNSNERELSSELKKFLFKNFKNSPECENYYDKGDYRNYKLKLDKDGLYIDETSIACWVDFIVPYDKLLPFLTPAGKEAVRSIMRQQ
jgi:hypothetical protein